MSKLAHLVLHIGAGKTGTSAIQSTLRNHASDLGRHGVAYCGLAFEIAPGRRHPWQQTPALLGLPDLPTTVVEDQLSELVMAVVDGREWTDCPQLIWSNEQLLRRGSFLLAAIPGLQRRGIEVSAVAYVRRHDAWVRSAYAQWGIRHKGYRGNLRTFHEWATLERLAFAPSLEAWSSVLGDRLSVRNFDQLDDVVADFLRLQGLADAGIPSRRNHRTPVPEELVLRAMFNSMFTEAVPASRFDREVGRYAGAFDQDAETYLRGLVPSAADIAQVAGTLQDDRRRVDELLQQCGQPALPGTDLEIPPPKVDAGVLTAALSRITMHHARAMAELEARMANMEQAASAAGAGKDPAVPDAGLRAQPRGAHAIDDAMERPVFLISTGRSGSTLVQRILNCHAGLVVWGEHHGFLAGLAAARAKMYATTGNQFPRTPGANRGRDLLLPRFADATAPIEWVNPCAASEFDELLRAFVQSFFGRGVAAGQRWGFKEIRYNDRDTLAMLAELFPRGRFVFIRRSVVDVVRSKVFAFVKEARWAEMGAERQRAAVARMVGTVRAHYQVFEGFLAEHPERSFALEYEDLVASFDAVVAALLDRLELPPDGFDQALAHSVMGSVISRTKRDDRTTALIRELVGD